MIENPTEMCVEMRVGPLYASAKMAPQGKLNLHQKAVKLKYIICLGCCIDNHRPILVPLLSKWQHVDRGAQIIIKSSLNHQHPLKPGFLMMDAVVLRNLVHSQDPNHSSKQAVCKVGESWIKPLWRFCNKIKTHIYIWHLRSLSCLPLGRETSEFVAKKFSVNENLVASF